MATFYFIGGEDHDFQRIGVTSVDTATTAARNTTRARCSLKVGGSAAPTDGWQGAFSTTLTSFWFTARAYTGASVSSASAVYDWLSFMDGTARRLMISNDGSNPPKIAIKKQDNAGSRTTLATSTNALAINTLYKIDVQVSSYGASATVNVYLDGVLWVTYTGDVTTNSSTSLSGCVLGIVPSSSLGHTTNWSEVICSDSDTRSMNLVTLPPAANGNAWAWSNSYANVDETTLDDSDIATSSSAGDIAQATVNSSGITGSPAILAVCVSARAQKGGTGPQNADLGVRTGGANYWSSDVALPAAVNRISNIWTTNPGTAGAWAYTDLTAAGFNIGIKSVT